MESEDRVVEDVKIREHNLDKETSPVILPNLTVEFQPKILKTDESKPETLQNGTIQVFAQDFNTVDKTIKIEQPTTSNDFDTQSPNASTGRRPLIKKISQHDSNRQLFQNLSLRSENKALVEEIEKRDESRSPIRDDLSSG